MAMLSVAVTTAVGGCGALNSRRKASAPAAGIGHGGDDEVLVDGGTPSSVRRSTNAASRSRTSPCGLSPMNPMRR